MSDERPTVIVLGGINGAGKTTSSRRLLADRLGLMSFVNADDIARGLNAFAPEKVAFEAGRVMLQRLDQLREERADFAFESTLAGKGYIRFLTGLKSEGYRVELFYFFLPSVEDAVRRVAARVSRGGHHIPDETIRTRYHRSIENFWERYRPHADEWYIFDNGGGCPILTATGQGSDDPSITDVVFWPRFEERLNYAAQRPS
jgi:predicted ABC-type ATPase